ncbi:MAG: CoA-binding protein [Flavobacteriales bacterium]|nr:CoA-binding protein [Flavobacteriales bacterium]
MKTVVIGASPNPSRYAFRATLALKDNGFEVVPVGRRSGMIDELAIHTDRPHIPEVHTVTLYVGPQNQGSWMDYIWSLHPKRIIFNPGTENPNMEALAHSRGIETVVGCTLVMLAVGTYE